MTPNALPVGTIVQGRNGSYRILEVLGSGGFGITYRVATQIKYGAMSVEATMAMKELFIKDRCHREDDSLTVRTHNPADTTVAGARKDFMAEARRLSEFARHPSIVSVGECFEANGTAYYVMEYLDGVSLKDYVESQPAKRLDLDQTVSIILTIASALKEMHSHRITHLDIKPGNIIMRRSTDGTSPDVPVIIDFGLSKHYDNDGNATSTINLFAFSEGYAPIEQYDGITTFNPQADVYSLAATMLFCLTGRKPPRASELADELDDILESLPIKPIIRVVLARALSSSRKKRYSTIEDFADALSYATGSINTDTVTGDTTTKHIHPTQTVTMKTDTVTKMKPTVADHVPDKPKTSSTAKTPFIHSVIAPTVACLIAFVAGLWLIKTMLMFYHGGMTDISDYNEQLTLARSFYGITIFIIYACALGGTLNKFVCPVLTGIVAIVLLNATSVWDIDPKPIWKYIFLMIVANIILFYAILQREKYETSTDKPQKRAS